MGSCPDWYVLVRAARYLGVPPWILMDQSKIWLEWALAAETAELGAQASSKGSTGEGRWP